MKRASESSSSHEDSTEKKSRTNISNNISGGVNLESIHMSGSSIGNALELQSECTVEIVNADDGTQIIQDDDSLAGETSLGVLVEYMDITEPLTTLRALLEQRTGVNLSEYHFYLQDSQELEASKNLVNQCVQGEGLVQINVVISDTGGTKKINIVDVLKPAEEISLSPSVSDEVSARIFLLGDTTIVESTGHQQKGKVASPADPQQVTRWIIAPQFRKLQERHKIPNDPSNWSEEHVRIWLEWSTHHFKIPNVDLSEWVFTGKELINMSQQSFKTKICVDPGDLFWTHLELLRKFKIVAIIQQPVTAAAVVAAAAAAAEKHSDDEKVIRNKRVPRIGPPKLPYEGCPGNNGQIQLWQFLLELLTDKDFRDFIQWVGNEGEFKLMNPEMVAQLWGQRKNKPTMNYEKLSRALRYYYDGEMLAKVHGKRFVYKFVCDLKSLLGYDALELNRLVTECELKKAENFHQGAVLAFQTVDSNSCS